MTLIVEKANQRTWASLYTFGEQPGRGGKCIQPETGVAITRLTDCVEYKGLFAGKANIAVGSPKYGITNGYSRFECVSPDGKNALFFGSTPYSILHSITGSSVDPVRVLTSAYTSTKKIGDLEETKWNPADGRIYYMAGKRLFRQNLAGIEELVYEYPFLYKSTSDGSFDNAGRRLAMALYSPKITAIVNGVVVTTKPDEWFVSVVDIVTKQELMRIPYRSPNGVDISPSGKYLKVDNYYWDIESKAQIGSTQAGHGGWCIDADGVECFVSQHNSCGWIVAYYPHNKAHLYLQRMPGEDGTLGVAGIHVASDKRGYFKGFALVSTYGGSSGLSNNVYFLELKSQKSSGLLHPSYGGSLDAWNKGTVGEDQMPRVIRIAHMQNQYLSAYFTEGWASVGVDKKIYWGGNWNGASSLDVYSASLPQDIMDTLVKPEFPKTYTFTGPGEFKAQLPEGTFSITVEKTS